MQMSLMTGEESRYADILIARGAQRKHLAKKTEIRQTEATKLGQSDGEIEIGKSILPKGSTSEISQFISILGIAAMQNSGTTIRLL